MTTATELVNSSLRKVGAKRITDITDAVGSAGIASDVLNQERLEALRSGVWNFAVIRANLAPLVAAPVYEFQYAFALPSDCLRVVSVHDNDGGFGNVRYKIESVLQSGDSRVNAIVCGASELWLRYVRDVTDYNEMTPSFLQILILRMARIFAISIAKSNQLYAALTEELKTATRSARSVDGIEDFIDQPQEGSWAASRRGYGRSNAWWPDSV